jgi:hypothetical protein
MLHEWHQSSFLMAIFLYCFTPSARDTVMRPLRASASLTDHAMQPSMVSVTTGPRAVSS